MMITVLLGYVVAAEAIAPPPPQPKLLWEFPIENAIVLDAKPDRTGRPFLYVSGKEGGVIVLALRGEEPPRRAAQVPVRQLAGLHAMSLEQSGNRLFVALGDFFAAQGDFAGLAVIDIADPTKPKVVTTWRSPSKVHGSAAVLARDNTVFLGAMTEGVLVFDVTNGRLRQIGRAPLDPDFPRDNPPAHQRPNARGLVLRDNLLYVANDAGGFWILDVSDPARPREVSRYVNPRMRHKQQAYNGIVLRGNYAYVAVDYAGMEVLDISNPRSVREVAWWNPWHGDSMSNLWFGCPGHTNQIEWVPGTAQVVMSAGDSEVVCLDVANPASPVLAWRYGGLKDGQGAWGVGVGELGAGRCVAYGTYIRTFVPFSGQWSGIRAIQIPR